MIEPLKRKVHFVGIGNDFHSDVVSIHSCTPHLLRFTCLPAFALICPLISFVTPHIHDLDHDLKYHVQY